MFMKILHVYNQGLHHDVRTRRYGKVLTENFYDLEFYLVGQSLQPDDVQVEYLSDRFKIIRLNFFFKNKKSNQFKFLNFTYWLINVLGYMMKQKEVRIISAHSLKVLPICLIGSIIKGAKLIYDTHEIETHTTNNKLAIGFLSFLERICMLRVQHLIVTSPGHKEWYEKEYKKKILYSLGIAPV